MINKCKEKNSAVLLDEIGNQGRWEIVELAGVLGRLMTVVRSHRTGWLEADPANRNLPIPAVPQTILDAALEGRIALNSAAARRESANKTDAPTHEEEKKISAVEKDVIVIDDD